MWKLISQLNTGEVVDPLPKPGTDDANLIGIVFNWAFMITAAIGVLIIIVAGIRLMMSRGDPQAVAKARNTIMYVAIGLVVMSLAYVIVGVALGVLGG